MLNSEQLRAVERTTGPCLVIAGAGTGKTKTIVEKIAFLIRSGVEPAKILALTFSNEAAAQLKERSVALIPEARDTSISTFHSFCADFIRQHANQCGVPATFSILEELDAAILLKRELEVETGTALRFANTISKAKDLFLTPDDYRRYLDDQANLISIIYPDDWELNYHRAIVRIRTAHTDTIRDKKEIDKLRQFVDLYENYESYKAFLVAWLAYEELKKKSGALDYADLNKLVLEYAERYDAKDLDAYDYIIVDEFQDTNRVQFELLEYLAAKKNITVVGDQNQTVYAFRGAYANNIDKFRKAFGVKDEDVVKLHVNYRSSNRILRNAHRLITNNYDNPEDSLLLRSIDTNDGEAVKIIQAEDVREQARRVVEEIESLTKSGMAYKDIAILYRSHSSAGAIKRALAQRGLPYSVAGGADFLYRSEVKTVAAYLYVLNNFHHPLHQAEQAWWKLLHGRFGLNAGDSTKLAEYKKIKKISLQDALYHHLDKIGLSKDGIERIASLTSAIDLLRHKENKRVSELLLDIYDISGLGRQYKDDREAMMNLRYLHKLAQTFESFHGDDIQSFVAYLEIIDEMGSKLESSRTEEEESIKLMTIHAAKGLEFEAVFLIDMVKDKFPLTRGGAEPLIPLELNEQYEPVLSETYKTDKDKEKAIKEFSSMIKLREERRLAYVALTRPKKFLSLTLAKDYGSKELRDPSQFLMELGADPNWFEGKLESKLEINQASGTSALSSALPAENTHLASDLLFTPDKDIRAKEGGDTELDRAAAIHKKLMNIALDRRDLRTAQHHMIIYNSLLEGHPVGKGDAAKEASHILENIRLNMPTGLRFNPSMKFSVSSISTFSECAKKYELKHVLNMPSRDDEEDTSRGFGNIIHEILEMAVRSKIKSREELGQILSTLASNDTTFDIPRAQRILDVFWERNAQKIKTNLETEKRFSFSIDGFNFVGKIDRIDYLGSNKVRIIDYKTGYINSDVSKDDRERQLIMYALAVENDPVLQKNKWIPAELILEMLEREKPLEFILVNGTMEPKEGRIKPVTVEEIKKSIIETTKQIADNYERGFSVAESDVPCRFCSYKLYCPKWDK